MGIGVGRASELNFRFGNTNARTHYSTTPSRITKPEVIPNLRRSTKRSFRRMHYYEALLDHGFTLATRSSLLSGMECGEDPTKRRGGGVNGMMDQSHSSCRTSLSGQGRCAFGCILAGQLFGYHGTFIQGRCSQSWERTAARISSYHRVVKD